MSLPPARVAAAPGHRARGPLHMLGVRMAGHSSIYVAGALLASMYGLTQVAVLTRVMPRDEFGGLAVLIFYSGLITTICNLFFVTGTMLTFPFSNGQGGGGGLDDEDGGDEDEVVDDRQTRQPDIDRRKLLGTGMTIALLLTAGFTALSALLAPQIAGLLGDSGQPAGVVWATLAGGLGSVWRMVTSVPRYERRPARYVALQSAYWAVALGAAATLAYSGYGTAGAMAGIAIGHAVAAAIGLGLAWHKFRPAFVPAGIPYLGKRGAPYAAIAVPGFLTRHADVYILALYVPHKDLALYTVATRFTRIPALAAGGALLAFGPLARGPMRASLERDKVGDWARGRVVNYYALMAMCNIVALAIWADVIVRIVPDGYARAAILIQLFAVVAALHAAQGVLYRMSRIPQKIKRLRQMVWFSFFVTIGSALLLTPKFGVYGALASGAFAPLFALPFLVWLGARGPNPLPLGGWQLLRALILAIVCLAGAYAARALPHQAEVWVKIALTFGFPVLLVLTGVLPRSEAARLLGLVRGLWLPFSERARLRAAIMRMDPADRALLEALAIRHEDPDDVGGRIGETGDDVRRRLVQLLRSLGPGGEASPGDVAFADILLSTAPRIERDGLGNALAGRGHIDGLELDRLLTLIDRVRKLRKSTWTAGASARFSGRSVRPDQLPAG